MLKQLSAPQKILGTIILLFAWSLFTEQASADNRTGTIAFLSDRDLPPPFHANIKVYLIDADGLNEKLWVSGNLRSWPNCLVPGWKIYCLPPAGRIYHSYMA